MEPEEQEEKTSAPIGPMINPGQIQNTSNNQEGMTTVPGVGTSSAGLPAKDASTMNPSAAVAETASSRPPIASSVFLAYNATETNVNTVATPFFSNAIPDTTITAIVNPSPTAGVTLKRKLSYEEGGEVVKRPRREYVFVYNGH
jgi:hypothetical protein